MRENQQPASINVKLSTVNSKPILRSSFMFIFLLSLLYSFSTKAQKVSLIASRYKILIGEQITLQLKAEGINTSKIFLQSWFNIVDTANHLQVTERSIIDTIEINGLTNYLQKINITSFDSGNWKLPAAQLVLQEKVTGKQSILQTDSLTIEVLPVDVSALTDYHAIKDILDVNVQPNYWLYAAIAALIIFFALIIWLAVKRLKKKKPAAIKPLHHGSALEYALEQLKELQHDTATNENSKLFYTKLTLICRNYFEKHLQVRSSQATSDELMILLGVYLPDEKSRTSFYQLLRLADVVKFAKYIPGHEQNRLAIETAITSLQHIDTLTQHIKQHA